MNVRHSADPRLPELENKIWELQAQFERAATPLQRRIAQAAIEQTQRDYRAISQGPAFEPASAR